MNEKDFMMLSSESFWKMFKAEKPNLYVLYRAVINSGYKLKLAE